MAKKSLAELLNGVSVFGDYVVLGDGTHHPKVRFALCACKCGVVKEVEVAKLRSGRSTCCKDCAAKSDKRVTNKTHGMTNSGEYNIYKGIIGRCTNPRDARFARYGGAGIKLCDRWAESFENFYADMGPRPSAKHSVDRIDNNLGYSPENCRWALPVEQSANRDCTLTVEFAGQTVATSVLAKAFGIQPATLADRLKRGWDVEKALTTPVEDRKPRHNVNGKMLTASEIEAQYGVKRWYFNHRLRQGMTVMEAIALG